MSGPRYIAYFRASTEMQRGSGLGLEAHRIAVARYIAAHPGEVLGEFTEIESGRNSGRPQIREALRICRVFGAQLLVARLDRLARNTALIAGLLESGVEFLAVDMPLANRFTLQILAAVAEYESQLIAKRIKATLDVGRASGRKFGPPAGFNNGKFLDKAPRAAAYASRIAHLTKGAKDLAPLLARWRDEGLTLYAMITRLMDLGIPTPAGSPNWQYRTLQSVFRYAGEQLPKVRSTKPHRNRGRPRKSGGKKWAGAFKTA